MKEDKFCNKNHRPTLCWSCRRACGGCSWTARDPKTHEVRFEPVEGWEAEKTVVRGTSSRRQGHKLEGYISIAIFSLTWYTVASLTMTALGVPPPDVLTERWFKAWTTELVVVAGIKIFGKDETTL